MKKINKIKENKNIYMLKKNVQSINNKKKVLGRGIIHF
jgi:hypothetical protein